MTPAQLNLQNQLEQIINTDLTTQPLFNHSPVFFHDIMDQALSVVKTEQNSSTEQNQHQVCPEKHLTPPETNNYEQSFINTSTK